MGLEIMTIKAISKNLQETIVEGLESFPTILFQGDFHCRSAVLMAISERELGPSLLLTKRTTNVSTHKGQVSFPGGRREVFDRNMEETALRETFEEVGIDSKSVELAGRLNDYLSVTRSLVTPFVGFIHGSPQINKSTQEVAKVLWVPLRFFLNTKPRIEISKRFEKNTPVRFFDYEEEVIWGLTANIIMDFLEAVGHKIRKMV